MTSFELTSKELDAAKLLVKECLNGMGGSRPADLEDDEYTWIDPGILVDAGYSKHEAAGLFSSLSEKGFIGENEPKVWIVTTEGWRWLDTVWDV